MRNVLISILALFLPVTGTFAQPNTAAPPSAARISPKAFELLNATSPMSEMEQQFVQNFQASFSRSFENDPKILGLETRKPGLIKAVNNAVSAELRKQTPIEMANLSNSVAAIYQQVLSEGEMDQALIFFRSPSGMRMLDRMKAGGQTKIDELRNTGQLKQGANAALEKAMDGAAAAGIQGLSEADSAAIAAFGQTPASLKMAIARPQIMAAMGTEVENMSRRLSERIGPVAINAVQRHLQTK